jgi:hypothetical protein
VHYLGIVHIRELVGERKFCTSLLHHRQGQNDADYRWQEPHDLLGQQWLFKNT